MISPFNSKILGLLASEDGSGGVRLEAPEDSSILYYAAARAARNFKKSDKDANIGLVDICTGSGIVPVHLLERGSVNEFVGLDIYIEGALKLRERLTRHFSHTDWQGCAHFKEFNIYKEDAQPIIEEIRARVGKLILSSNPPWVPTPPSLMQTDHAAHFTRKHEIDFWKLAAFMGGEDGLKHYPKILEIAQKSGADHVCINAPSAGNMKELVKLLSRHSFEIEFIDAVETMTYGFDGTPKLQKHLRREVRNNFCRESGQGLKYLIMGLLLRKIRSKKSKKNSEKDFFAFLKSFKRGELSPGTTSPFFSIRGLTKKDQARMTTKKRRKRRRRRSK